MSSHQGPSFPQDGDRVSLGPFGLLRSHIFAVSPRFFFGLFSFYRCRVYVLQISMCIPQRWEVQQIYKIVRKTVH